MAIDKAREIALPIAELLQTSILEEREKIKDMPIEQKIEKFIRLVQAMKMNSPAVNLNLEIPFDPAKADAARKIIDTSATIRKALSDG